MLWLDVVIRMQEGAAHGEERYPTAQAIGHFAIQHASNYIRLPCLYSLRAMAPPPQDRGQAGARYHSGYDHGRV